MNDLHKNMKPMLLLLFSYNYCYQYPTSGRVPMTQLRTYPIFEISFIAAKNLHHVNLHGSTMPPDIYIK